MRMLGLIVGLLCFTQKSYASECECQLTVNGSAGLAEVSVGDVLTFHTSLTGWCSLADRRVFFGTRDGVTDTGDAGYRIDGRDDVIVHVDDGFGNVYTRNFQAQAPFYCSERDPNCPMPMVLCQSNTVVIRVNH